MSGNLPPKNPFAPLPKMTIPVTVQCGPIIFSVNALLDSGSDESLMDESLASQYCLPLVPLDTPIALFLADGQPATSPHVNFQTHFIDQLLPCSFFNNLTADLPHPAHRDGSQLLPYDDFDYMPESNFDEDDIISVNLPDVNVVDAPVVRLKHGRPSSDIWTWFTNDTNSHHLKSATCKHCNLLINHHKKNECARLHLNK
ncbi:hypothetical protein BASA60_001911 [Batrachochytrium salamandrivorans]|nr:hypothetical protein BASA60_001911 [Batrachochytrium salamandrivorans]